MNANTTQSDINCRMDPQEETKTEDDTEEVFKKTLASFLAKGRLLDSDGA